MVFTGKTAIVSNKSDYYNNLYNKKTTTVYRKRYCDTNLNSNDPSSQYQRLKLIQNTVRVPSSIYTMNLGALNVYEHPKNVYQTIYNNGSTYVSGGGVNWNQMSDRSSPHKQVVVTSSGSTYRGSSTKRTIVSCKPGALSPGGVGCDIKHNSYERYLNRIKGKAPLRRGIIPPNFGSPISFNRAYPIYGGKVTKTNIVNGCDCITNVDDKVLYEDNNYKLDSVKYIFNIGDKVYTFVKGKKLEGIILTIDNSNNNYAIQLLDGSIVYKNILDIIIYYQDKCKIIENKDNDSQYDYDINYIINNSEFTDILGPDIIV
jgi:hypothetical protein